MSLGLPDIETITLDQVRAGNNRLVLLCGNAGTGKSRLIEEFKSGLNPDWLESSD